MFGGAAGHSFSKFKAKFFSPEPAQGSGLCLPVPMPTLASEHPTGLRVTIPMGAQGFQMVEDPRSETQGAF